jgi:hypothetical protein
MKIKRFNDIFEDYNLLDELDQYVINLLTPLNFVDTFEIELNGEIDNFDKLIIDWQEYTFTILLEMWGKSYDYYDGDLDGYGDLILKFLKSEKFKNEWDMYVNAKKLGLL